MNTIFEASYQNPTKARQSFENLGYSYDTQLSTPEHKVFVDEQGQPNIAFRGSKRVEDFLISDPLVAIGLSKYDPRHRESSELVRKVNEKYNRKPNLYGHSLGGHLAASNAAQANQVFINNSAVGLGDSRTLPKNVQHTRNSNDLVSGLSVFQKGNIKTNFNPFQSPLQAHSYKPSTLTATGLNVFNKIRSPFF
jgi:hypothetical protein